MVEVNDRTNANLAAREFREDAAVRRGRKKVSVPKRIRQSSKPLMNKLETQFWRVLCLEFGDPQVMPQALKLKLGNGIFYTPDFVVTQPGVGIVRCYEVKGPHAFRGGFENLKVAAHQWLHVKWYLVWKDGPHWRTQQVLP